VGWFRKAADQGSGWDQFNLGAMYWKGLGVAQDYIEAHKWLNLSAAGATDADLRDKAIRGRDLIAAKMT
ncbi:hypothetical protein ACSTHI_23510, partial [Vibrio parahaemolyticus]